MRKAIIVPSAGGGDLEPEMAALSAIFEQLQGGTTMGRDARFLLNLRLVEMGLLAHRECGGRSPKILHDGRRTALVRFSRPITAIDLRSRRSSASCSFFGRDNGLGDCGIL